MTPATYTKEYPFRPNFLETDGGRLHYLDEGPKDAPPLLLLHGNPTWSFYYRKIVQAFAGARRVIVPDHLGCGLSDKPQAYPYTLERRIAHVGQLIEHLGLGALDLGVHDWGGAIGMGWATAHPERINKLVVFNTAAFPAQRIPFSINVCRIPLFGAVAIRGLNAFAKVALLRCVVHKERLTPEVKAGYLAPYDTWAHRVANLRFVEDIPMSPAHPSYATLSRIGERLSLLESKPMLIVWGAQDFCFDDSFYTEWKTRFPRAECHYLEDAGHYVVEDAHERIIPWMTAHLLEQKIPAGVHP